MELLLITGVWVIQTFVGAVLWRKFNSDDTKTCFWISFFVLPNVAAIIAWTVIFSFHGLMYLWNKMIMFIDYLAGKKDKKNNRCRPSKSV